MCLPLHSSWQHHVFTHAAFCCIARQVTDAVRVCVKTCRVPHSSVKLLHRIYANNAKYPACWLIPLSEK